MNREFVVPRQPQETCNAVLLYFCKSSSVESVSVVVVVVVVAVVVDIPFVVLAGVRCTRTSYWHWQSSSPVAVVVVVSVDIAFAVEYLLFRLVCIRNDLSNDSRKLLVYDLDHQVATNCNVCVISYRSEVMVVVVIDRDFRRCNSNDRPWYCLN